MRKKAYIKKDNILKVTNIHVEKLKTKKYLPVYDIKIVQNLIII